MKPKLYKVNGLWYCKVKYFGYSLLGVGKNTPKAAYDWWMNNYFHGVLYVA